ncbi:hypothetical protein Anas_12985 [Armadillidium nasatum]|uniref:Uncharacterized protein n=1 Tax=Armadillidium nasatum TaxID=96803 RepID=A0A5N5SUE7_9CRUS|nr:hypothetical protein Anas_12985 [Armadillidium nasatum]
MNIITLVILLISLLVIIPTEVYGKAKPKADVTITAGDEDRVGGGGGDGGGTSGITKVQEMEL